MRTPFDRERLKEFAPDESARIRELILTDGASLDCPLCNIRLTGGGLGGRASHVETWELHCEPCCRFIVVEDSLHL